MKRKLVLSFILASVFATNVLVITYKNENRPAYSADQTHNNPDGSKKNNASFYVTSYNKAGLNK